MAKVKNYLIAFAVFLVFPFTAFAVYDIPTILNNVMSYVLWPLFLGVATIMILWAGIMFLTARGDPNKIALARKTTLMVVVGAVIGVVAYYIIETIKGIVGL